MISTYATNTILMYAWLVCGVFVLGWMCWRILR